MDQGWSPTVSKVLKRELRADSLQSYFLYVPTRGGHGAPVFVSVHGISRNARRHARLFAPYCEKYGVVLVAPQFSADQHPDYQRLGRRGRGDRADLALDAILAEVAAATGAAASQIRLFGYSGGAQFAQRYTLAHPHRVRCTVLASAGWYTFPDPKRRFPYGLRPTRSLPGVRFDPEEFLSVPMTVLAGSGEGAERRVRRSARLDAQQGKTRLERARNWVAAMQEAAGSYRLESRVRLEEGVDQGRSFRLSMTEGGLGDRVFAALFGPPPLAESRPDAEAADAEAAAADAAEPGALASRKVRRARAGQQPRRVAGAGEVLSSEPPGAER